MTWLTTAEAAEYLRRDPTEIRRMAAAGGTFPAHKSLGRWRFDRDELDAWVRGQTPTTTKRPRSMTTRPRK